MNNIDVLDTAVNINGHVLEFPMSYGEVKELLGEARIVTDGDAEVVHTTYYYDELGIEFEGSVTYLSKLKRKKAYKDNDHNIVELTLYVTGDNIYEFKEGKCENKYVGDLTVLGKKIERDNTWKSILGFGCQPLLDDKSKTKRYIQIMTSIVTEEEEPFYLSRRRPLPLNQV